MNKEPATPQNLDQAALVTVTGGTGLDASPKIVPITPPTGMAPPKYSAGWWDFVRAKGGQ